MTNVQYFPTIVVLSVTHGKLLCDMGEVYRICNFLTGDNLFTHQLPRAADTLTPWILEQHPKLREWDSVAGKINERNWQPFVTLAEDKFGESLALTPLPRERWTHINPIEEIKAMVGDDKVIVINPEDMDDEE